MTSLDDQLVLERLALGYEVELCQDLAPRETPYALPAQAELHLPAYPAESEQQRVWYWSALHELAHLVLEHQPDDSLPAQILAEWEAQAWLIAFELAERPLDVVGASLAAYAFSSYWSPDLYEPPEGEFGHLLALLAPLAQPESFTRLVGLDFAQLAAESYAAWLSA